MKLCLGIGANLPLRSAKGVSEDVRGYTGWHYYAQVYIFVGTKKSHTAIPGEQAG
jgi:hypothetical protein